MGFSTRDRPPNDAVLFGYEQLHVGFAWSEPGARKFALIKLTAMVPAIR
jgi:hypothetical protein